MASKYWIKLYHEMLDDPKVMTLSTPLRWRFIETLLVAGEMDEAGYLPDVQSYAWRVRDNAEIVETEFIELANSGLLSREDGRWLVTKFAERQAPVSPAERMRHLRSRKQKEEYYAEDTNELQDSYDDVTKRNAEKIREDIDTDEEWTPTPFSELSGAIVNITHIPELTGGAKRWTDAINFMVEKGVTVEDVETAYNEVKDRYNIAGPWSLQTPAMIAMSKRKSKDVTGRAKLEDQGYEFRS